MRRARSRQLTDLLLAAGALGGFAGWVVGIGSNLPAFLAAACILVLGIQHLPAARPLYPLLSRGPGVRPYLADDVVVTFDATGIHRTIGSISVDVAWLAIGSIKENELYIHIIEGRGPVTRWRLTIPKRALSDAQLEAVHEVLAVHPTG